MWHEARKQERRIRGLIVDYRKRAERRQYFYSAICADPTQFLQLHGRRCKIYLDPAVAAAGDGDAIIVPWQGQQDNLIDRFDVRAHLDYIAPVGKSFSNASGNPETELTVEERQLNYERYRILAQNDFLNLCEDKFLHQLYLEEQFGANAQLEAERNIGKKKQKSSSGGATIGYSYEESREVSSVTIGPQPFGIVSASSGLVSTTTKTGANVDKAENTDNSDSDIDMDVSIDIAKLDTAQAHELNACGRNYGMKSNDFFSHLTKDADEADALRIAREEEQEKMLLSGRKSRRERRAQKERRIANRPFSPPSYAAKEDQSQKNDEDEDTESHSPSPVEGVGDKITYITSFGADDEMQSHSKITINLKKSGQTLGESCISATSVAATAATPISYAQKVKENLDTLKIINDTSRRSRRRVTRSSSSSSPNCRRNRYRKYHRWSRTPSRGRSQRRRKYYSRSSSSCQHYTSHSRSPSHKRTRKRFSHSSCSSSSNSYSNRRSSRSHSVRSRAHSIVQKQNEASTSRTQKSIGLIATSSGTILTSTHHVPLRQMELQQSRSLSQKAPTVPMISYPMSTRVLSLAATATGPTAAVSNAVLMLSQVTEAPPPPLKRYYGRKRGNNTSSSSSAEHSEPSDRRDDINKQPKSKSLRRGRVRDDSDEMDMDTASERSQPLMSSSTTGNQTGKYSSATDTKGCVKPDGVGRPNLRERLKRKMQNLLNRQYKADKRAEIEKTERERQLQQEREEKMRELALKLRRRRRELRHKYGTPSSGKVSDSEIDSEESVAPGYLHKSHARNNRSRSFSRGRNSKSGSRSQDSESNLERKQRTRSPSKDRRQRSRSRRSITRRERKHKARSLSRNRTLRTRSRSRRSNSRSERNHRVRSPRQHCMERNRDREHYRQHQYYRTQISRDGGNDHGSNSNRGNRGRVVISAPPKLKKLVDY
ncbi:CLK4-associating serine/arginine rich protein isoform X1 [Drosophila busckii]|uniref:CLK4-associating serine/arginine rich protein isoform X1 n=2 Tax=Drosophila busckii TaxID=30019 RepID=UPI00083F3D0D|nr:CLK4-associating serine/arginine rich protein isoform X1 [Drosophila busckii]